MNRREFLKQGLATAGGAALVGAAAEAVPAANGAVRTLKIAATAVADGFYTPNRAPLQPTAFLKLPPGSITLKGWLRHQLDLQVDGLNGRMTEVSDYLDYENCGWVHPEKVGWEELTYWLRGFGDLGYVTGDERVLALTRKWIDGVLATQQPDGWFGPTALRTSLEGGPDLWPAMPLLDAMRSFYEFTGDARILPFLTKYFQFQNQLPSAAFNRGWGAVRWGDSIDCVYWLYNRTGDAWLPDLATKMHTGSADYTNGIPTWHNVNLAQGFREPAQYGLLAKDPRFRAATYRDYETVMDRYGQFPGGGFAGDENCRPGYADPRQGFETCGIVEFMHSFEMLTRITGDPLWADRCEEIAFNSMPAAFDPEQKGTHYITSANSIQIDNIGKKRGQFANGTFPMQAYMPGVHNYRCCPHNYGMGWPYYAEELWLATADKGLCASLYAASEVKAKVGDGATVKIVQETDYPFGDTIHLKFSSPRPVAFPLYLRIPRWCKRPTLRINGRSVKTEATPLSYVVVERTWKDGDGVTLHLPMETAVRTWPKNHNAVSVDHGPLTYSLAIQEKWSRIGGTDRWPEYEVTPQSAWNYGLVLDRAQPGRSFETVKKNGALASNPFTHEGAPILLRAKARCIPNWRADSDNVVTLLQTGPIKSDAPIETVTLIPMGAARLRITVFPIIGGGPDAHEWLLPNLVASASHLWNGDTLTALNDGLEPKSSYDMSTPRFTWWDHQGTAEWVQYDYKQPITASAVSVYWFDDAGHGGCRVPKSWRLLYKDGGQWKPVENASSYGTARDAYNRVTFTPITTSGLRIEVQLQAGVSGGVLEWKVETKDKA